MLCANILPGQVFSENKGYLKNSALQKPYHMMLELYFQVAFCR